MAGLSQRLARLEEHVTIRQTSLDHRAFDRRSAIDRAAPWLAGWHLLRETMAPRHVAHVEAAVFPLCWSFVCRRAGEVLRPDFGVPFELRDTDPLVHQVNRMISDARPGTAVAWRGPFALPELVADAYQSRPTTNANDECELCGYRVLADWFECCPLCGGAVRCNGYYRKHVDFAPVFTIPLDLIDTYRHELAPFVETLLDEADVINRREQRVVGT